MKTLRTFLVIPALALCATFRGTVVDLSGAPLVGAVVKTAVDSAITGTGGTWSLARTSSIAHRKAAPIAVASHLVLENGRPRLDFGGVDASGHRSPSVQTTPPRLIAARTTAAAGTDTLKLFWKGKRLVVLPVASTDSTGVTLRIDTAWSDDEGIPWNGKIDYGSLKDDRDGQVYRTVKIGVRTWMGENLNFVVRPGAGSWVFGDSIDFSARLGRLYSWATALGLPDSCDKSICSTRVVSRQGICPAGWSVPTDAEWTRLIDDVEADPRVGVGMASLAIKSVSGWVENGSATDLFGFRALPAGWNSYKAYRLADSLTYFRTATEYDETSTWGRSFLYGNATPFSFRFYFLKYQGYSLRCLKD